METHAMRRAKAFDPQEYRDNPTMISEYLNQSLATDDLSSVVAALAAVVKAQNVVALSEEAAIRRETFYKAPRQGFNAEPQTARRGYQRCSRKLSAAGGCFVFW